MNLNEIFRLYDEGVSIRNIAKKFNSYPSKIYKILLDNNRPIRNKSQAQKLLLETGKIQHPTQGKQRSDETKNKISTRTFDKWNKKTKEEKEAFRKQAKEKWEKLPQEVKDKMNNRAKKAIQATTRKGSKMEHFLLEKLTTEGYLVFPHRSNFLPNEKLEVDLLIPSIKTAIEVDGPSHFKPVWGEDELERTKKSDDEKDALLLHYGYGIIRIRYTGKHFALAHQRLVMEKLLPVLKDIENGTSEKRFIIEVLC